MGSERALFTLRERSIGHRVYVGGGAYTTVILVADHDWSYLATLPVSAAVCFLAGLVVGVPATRVKGMYLGVITLAVAYVFPPLVLKFGWLTGGVNGKGPGRTEAKLRAPSWMPFAYDGVAGSMLIMNRPFATDAMFGTRMALFLVVGLVAGGVGSISGAVPGAFVYLFVPHFVGEWTL